MKLNFTKSIVLLLLGTVMFIGSAIAQDASINILAGSNGLVAAGGTFLLRIDVTNNDATGTVAQNKVRPQISVPASISSISLTATDHTLPAGWTITSNTGSVIRITNTTDPIPSGVTRTAYIMIKGNTVGTGSIIANLTFVGAAPTGDIGANNSSSTGIEVTNPTPVTLSELNATVNKCQPVLNWVTETEVNSAQFEIERGKANNTGWVTIGTVAARGFATTKYKYNFADITLNTTDKKVLYRLKMIDKDGRYQYSNVLPVSLNCNSASASVFPNPVQDGKLYISLTGASANTAVSLSTLTGQTVLQGKVTNGTNYLNVSSVAPGIYILHLQDESGFDKKVKVLVQ